MVQFRHITAIALSISVSMWVTACSAVKLPKSSLGPANVADCTDNGLTVDAQKCRIKDLIGSYVSDLENLQYERTVYNVTTLVAGLVAAAGLIYGANDELIAGAGLTAGATQVLATGGAPAQKQLLLVQASRRLTCAANKTESAQSKAETAIQDEATAAGLLRDTVDTIEQTC